MCRCKDLTKDMITSASGVLRAIATLAFMRFCVCAYVMRRCKQPHRRYGRECQLRAVVALAFMRFCVCAYVMRRCNRPHRRNGCKCQRCAAGRCRSCFYAFLCVRVRNAQMQATSQKKWSRVPAVCCGPLSLLLLCVFVCART